MKVEVERQGSVNVIIPHDAINESAVPEMQRTLAQESAGGSPRMVFDMTHVPFVDSAGLEYLLETAGNANSALRPRLAALNETVRETMYLTDVLRRFQIFDSVEAAVRSYL